MIPEIDQFDEILMVDFEYSAPSGESPKVICMVVREFKSGKTMRYWRDELLLMSKAPFSTGADSLFIAFYAVAEMSCFLQLGWPYPENILDLFVEFRCLTNVCETFEKPQKANLIAVLRYFGLVSIDVIEKETMRELAMRGGSYTEYEKSALLEYCESDVVALDQLFNKMAPYIDWPRAIFRGHYTKAAAYMELNGIPMDINIHNKLVAHWSIMKESLIAAVDLEYNVYEGITFKTDKFISYIGRSNIAWPMSPTGLPNLDDNTFKEMAIRHPQLQLLAELRRTLSGMRNANLSIGNDDRNRCMLSIFRSKTGRNQPSTAEYIFGRAVWERCLIKCADGNGIAYIDWSQQEFGIAAALSGDQLMLEAYESGDPYLEFAKQAKLVPADATKQSHKHQREQAKQCVLAVLYGMGPDSLASRLNTSVFEARYLLDLHNHTYKTFWHWSDSSLDYAMLTGELQTVFGWKIKVGQNPNCRSLRNFPMQANGAEMLRLACIYAMEARIKICAPVHDAVLIEAPLAVLNEHIRIMQDCMVRASRDVLGGFGLRTSVDKFVYPDRYMDDRGKEMWAKVKSVYAEVTGEEMS